MYSRDQISELIEQYIENTLPENKITEIKQLIATDLVWKSEYDSQFAAHQFVKEIGFLAIQDEISKDLAKMKDPTSTSNTKYWVAGSGLIVIGTLLFVGISSKDKKERSFVKQESAPRIIENKKNVSILDSFPLNNELPLQILEKDQAIEAKKQHPVAISDKKEGETKITEEKNEITVKNEVLFDTKTKELSKNAIDLAKIETKTAIDPCLNFKPKATFTLRNPTFSQHNGSIEIISAENWSNFKVALGSSTKFQSDLSFENLDAGVYTIQVKNELNCSFKFESISLSNSNCTISEDQFTLSSDRVWTTKLNDKIVCSIQIMNKRRETVFEKTSLKNEIFEWDGLNSSGQRVTTGLYKVFIQYNNGEKCLLSLTVFE